MKYFKVNEALEVVAIADDMPEELKAFNPDGWYVKADGSRGAGWLNRNDMDLFMLAQQIAGSAIKFSSKAYMAIDKGQDVSPRFDVILAPNAGDDVSMAFNGDFYPVGKITAISASMKLITVNGPRGVIKFYRRGLSGSWLSKGFSLVPGAINKLNPEF